MFDSGVWEADKNMGSGEDGRSWWRWGIQLGAREGRAGGEEVIGAKVA